MSQESISIGTNSFVSPVTVTTTTNNDFIELDSPNNREVRITAPEDSYILNSLDQSKIDTEEIDLESTNIPSGLTVYDTLPNGLIDINKNNDIDNRKFAFTLYTDKTTNEIFESVIDTEFSEFTLPQPDPIPPLQQRIAELERLLADANAEAERDDVQIEQLREQIDILNQLIDELNRVISEFPPEPGVNRIPNAVSAQGIMISDARGLPGDPFFPLIRNRILSENRTAIAILLNDTITNSQGNPENVLRLMVYSGKYDSIGNLLPGETQEIKFASQFSESQFTSEYYTKGKFYNPHGYFGRTLPYFAPVTNFKQIPIILRLVRYAPPRPSDRLSSDNVRARFEVAPLGIVNDFVDNREPDETIYKFDVPSNVSRVEEGIPEIVNGNRPSEGRLRIFEESGRATVERPIPFFVTPAKLTDIERIRDLITRPELESNFSQLRLQIEDGGYLALYDGESLLWTSLD